MKVKAYQLILLFCLILAVCSNTQECADTDDQFLVTFHPHLDAFWLNLDTELKDENFRPAGFLYMMNQRNSKTILNSMMEALSQGEYNNARKYFVTQAVFFKDWYDYLKPQKKQVVKQLLAFGKLEIANGAWVENDEAVCYYDDILDQYTVGMKFLYDQFSYQVKIGWATDSFGHSHSQAALLHLLGVQFQGIQRVDDRYVNDRNGGALLQFYWTPVSDSNNFTYGGVLNHVRHFLHEVNNLRNARTSIIMDDFTEIKNAMNKYYHKNKLFRFLGNDFEEFVVQQFVNLQKAMKQLNTRNGQTCPAFKYGNPSDYLNLISKYYEKNTLPTRKWDFIPNWDQDHYWTGYYTTDPLLKKTCKDFSRLINFYRKSLLTTNTYKLNERLLQNSEQLLAVLQHHDGITATSKTYIEDQFRQRVGNKSFDIINSLKNIHEGRHSVVCKLYENNNECIISDIDATSGPTITSLSIVTHGGSRTQKIQIRLPTMTFFDIEEVQEDIFCENDSCSLVFEAALHPGVNKFKITQKRKQQMSTQIFQLEKSAAMYYSGRDFVVLVDSAKKHQVKYQYGDGEFYAIGLYTSANRGNSRPTVAWDKYGRRKDKSQYVVPGMYIMSNTGKIDPNFQAFTQLSVAQGRIYKRIALKTQSSKIKITIKNDSPNIIDLVHDFKPASRNMVDYFMKVQSNVRSDTLYHDANGFLVAKRPLNWRPDYVYNIKPDDIINANTYPVCSFAYLLQDNKKMLFFTDRAQGVASFEQDLLINYDRLAMDDGKGVGQGYAKTVRNSFRYKFAIISANDDTQRVWQQSYDQALIGFLQRSGEQLVRYSSDATHEIPHTPGLGPVNNLKYTIFWLNENQFILRLQNLAEFSNLMVTKYSGGLGKYQWDIQEIGFKLSFFDIKDSYANGIPRQNAKQNKTWRKYWSKASTVQVNLNNQGTQDGAKFSLRPLQIRSFRINTKQPIQTKIPNTGNIAAFGQIKSATHLRQKLRKRCF